MDLSELGDNYNFTHNSCSSCRNYNLNGAKQEKGKTFLRMRLFKLSYERFVPFAKIKTGEAEISCFPLTLSFKVHIHLTFQRTVVHFSSLVSLSAEYLFKVVVRRDDCVAFAP